MEIKAIKKPVVPQCVADWYEDNNGDLNGALFYNGETVG